MLISPVSFKALYKNPDGTVAHVGNDKIKQAKTTAKIKQIVDEKLNNSSTNTYTADCDKYGAKKLYFTIDENGKCVISGKKIPKIIYSGNITTASKYIHPSSQNKISTMQAFNTSNNTKYLYEHGKILDTDTQKAFARLAKDGEIEILQPKNHSFHSDNPLY